MQEAVFCQAEADQFGYSSSSKDICHPGLQTTHTNELQEEHIIFLYLFPSYLSYL